MQVAIFQKKSVRNKGFTLVELLVVISIISILSSVVVAATQQARERGNEAKARADIREITRAIIIAQGERGLPLVQIAPNANFTYVNCGWNIGTSPTGDACFARVDSAFTSIENATNGIVPPGRLPRRDPWGIPYQVDANFGESMARACTVGTETSVAAGPPCYCVSDSQIYMLLPTPGALVGNPPSGVSYPQRLLTPINRHTIPREPKTGNTAICI